MIALHFLSNRRDIENLHIFLWLMKDNAWCHEWRWLGMAFIVPTLLVQILLTWQVRKDVHEVFHAVAVICWIAANAIWMTGEFFFEDSWRAAPEVLFGAGLLSVAIYYLVHFRRGNGAKAEPTPGDY